jgi:twitching motility protein PilT
MATIDRYIELLRVPQAEALTFRANQLVELSVGGQGRPASKGPASSQQILQLMQEVLPPDFQQRAEMGPVDFPYTSPAGPCRIRLSLEGGVPSASISLVNGAPTPIQATLSGATLSGGLGGATLTPPAPVAAAPVHAPAASALSPASAPIIPKHMDELFTQMLDMKASDLHMKSGKVPMIRIHGDMAVMERRPELSPEDLYNLLIPIMPERNRKQYEEIKDTDFAYELPSGTRMRCNVFKDIAGVGAVFRQIPSKILSTKDLGVPPAVVKLCDYPKGLVLVTGPTGSGKSTTLAALIDHINDSEAVHIITIEDPVEFVHKDKKALVNQREVGVSTMSFKAALRAALREDPDVVLVGELRDLETTEIAIETAETGHLVFATLHTNTAAATVDRIINQFPADRQEQIRLMLSTSLLGVVSQTLCKKASGGRIAALEVLIATPAIANLVREGKTFQIPSAMQTGRGIGMQTLADALIDLMKSKQIDAEEAYRAAVDKKEMAGMLNRLGVRGPWTADAQAGPQ